VGFEIEVFEPALGITSALEFWGNLCFLLFKALWRQQGIFHSSI